MFTDRPYHTRRTDCSVLRRSINTLESGSETALAPTGLFHNVTDLFTGGPFVILSHGWMQYATTMVNV